MTYLVAGGDGTGVPAMPVCCWRSSLVAGSALTVAYTLRFLWGTFADKTGVASSHCHRVPAGFAVAPVILGALCLIGGFLGPELTQALMPYVDTFTTGEDSHGIALWHGFTVPLLMSVIALAVGGLLFWQRGFIARAQSTFPAAFDSEELYQRTMRGVDRLAVEVTARTQRGSLPVYLGSILLVVVLLPGGALMVLANWPSEVRYADTWAQLLVGLIMIAAAFLAATSRGRLQAVMLVGVTGYGVAMLFLLHGAPDLALTQMLVETVTLVIFALVLRKLPKYFTTRPLHSSRWWRLVIAIAVAVVVCLVTIVASGARIAVPISEGFYEAAYTFGYGKNIVNVTLVDIRAWDTLGEIAVLVVAATGVASLIFIRSRYSAPPTRAEVTSEPPAPGRLVWLRGSEALSPARRSIVFEVVTRVLFPVMIMVSIYLLIAGHNAPGGGFAGGLVAGMALVIRYLAAGRRGTRRSCAGRRRPSARGGADHRRTQRPGPRPVGRKDPAELRHRRRSRTGGRHPPGDLGLLRRRGLPRGDRGDAGSGPQPGGRHRPARGGGPYAEPAADAAIPGRWYTEVRRMSPNLVLVVIAGVLIGAGVYLLLERSLTRILIGVLLASERREHLVPGGLRPGRRCADHRRDAEREEMSDPLPQAMVLTAIVITLGVTAYLLALAYRSFQLNGHDEVADDVEDAAIRHLAEADRGSGSYDESVEGHPDEIGQGTGDEEGERVDEADAALRQAQGTDADAGRGAPVDEQSASAARAAAAVRRGHRPGARPPSAGAAGRLDAGDGAVITVAAILVDLTDRYGPVVLWVGAWPEPLGVALVADRLSALMLLVSAVGHARRAGVLDGRGRRGTQAGDAGVDLPPDAAGAGGRRLQRLPGRRPVQPFRRVRDPAVRLVRAAHPRRHRRRGCAPGRTYVVVSVLSSLLFLIAIASIYAATGTVNLAQLVGAPGATARRCAAWSCNCCC